MLFRSNRRADPSFSFPSVSFIANASSHDGLLPHLDELHLEGCSLGDKVTFSQEQDGSTSPKTEKRDILELISTSFPSLTILNLSHNNLSSDALSEASLKKLLFSTDDGSIKGLKVLRLRGNRLTSLDRFDAIASLFKANRQVSEWKLEELDVRDNDISKLPVNLGLLPLDVFLVDGNT